MNSTKGLLWLETHSWERTQNTKKAQLDFAKTHLKIILLEQWFSKWEARTLSRGGAMSQREKKKNDRQPVTG